MHNPGTETSSTVPAQARPAAGPHAAATGRSQSRIHTFASLRHADFRLLFMSTFFSAAAQWVQQITLGWLVYHLTGSELLLGALSGVRAVPFLLAGPLGGVAADRFNRKRLLIGTQILLAVSAFVFALDVALDYVAVWHIFVFAAVSGIGWAFNQPVRQSVVPSLVPRQDIMNAVALTSISFNINRILGPTVGGLLLASVGVSVNFFLQSALCVAFVLMLWPVKIPANKPEDARRSMAGGLMEGLRYVRHDQGVLSQLLLSLVPTLLIMPYSAMLPAYAKTVLNVGPQGLGFLYAAVGVGAVLGTLTLASLGNVAHKGWLLLAAAGLSSSCLVLLGLSHYLPLSLAALFGLGVGQVMFNSTNNAIIQLETPENYRGRVLSLYHTNHGVQPAGTFLIGGLAESFGVSGVEVVAGVLALGLTGSVALAFRRVRERR